MDWKELLRSKKLYLFDMDGTIYLDDTLFDFTKELLATLKATGRKYMFMTNNSSKSVEDYVKKLARLGIPSVEEEFITSAQATAIYLKAHHPGKALYVCGTDSFVKSLEDQGFPIARDPREAQAIVMSLDTELTFGKLRDVCMLLSTRPEIPYLASHPDLACPTEFGFVPDCGSICQMVFNATQRMPDFIGKPNPLMPELAMEWTGCTREETVVIGDRLSTDIESGVNAGIATVLVLTGEATLASSQQSQVRADIVLKDAGEILKVLK